MNSLLLHSGIAIYHVVAWKSLLHVNNHAMQDNRLSPVAEITTRLMTNWNFAFQTLIFYGYLIYDVLYLTGTFKNLAEKLKQKLDLVFNSIIGPMGIFVPTVFWTLWMWDKGLLNVFPEAAIDTVLPPWLNHAVHTAVLINVLVQAYHNKVSSVKFRQLLLPLTFFNVCYIFCIYLTYYEKRMWVYGFLRKLDEPFRLFSLLFLLMYSISLGVIYNYINHLYCTSQSQEKRKRND